MENSPNWDFINNEDSIKETEESLFKDKK
jgi:hypothetical protein